MASITTYRNKWLRLHKSYEKRALKELMIAFKIWGNAIPFNFLSEENYENLIESSATKEVMLEAYGKIYYGVGSLYGKRVGSAINKELKEFTFNTFISTFERGIYQWLFTNGGSRITLLQESYIAYINNVIATGLADGKTIREISADLQKMVNRRNFYRWQALRIARTETTTASNYSAIIAGEVSGFVTEKVWISAQDARTRRPPESHFNHYAMNGVKVGLNERFNVGGEKLLFPGGPKGSAGNVINCRCTVAIIPKRDAEGDLVRS